MLGTVPGTEAPGHWDCKGDCALSLQEAGKTCQDAAVKKPMRRQIHRQRGGQQGWGWGQGVGVAGAGLLTLPPQHEGEVSLFLPCEAAGYRSLWNHIPCSCLSFPTVTRNG